MQKSFPILREEFNKILKRMFYGEIRVFIDNKFDIVTSMIKNKLGKTENKIFARKCEIKHVDKQTSKEFQESNHIQGYVPSSIQLDRKSVV